MWAQVAVSYAKFIVHSTYTSTDFCADTTTLYLLWCTSAYNEYIYNTKCVFMLSIDGKSNDTIFVSVAYVECWMVFGSVRCTFLLRWLLPLSHLHTNNLHLNAQNTHKVKASKSTWALKLSAEKALEMEKANKNGNGMERTGKERKTKRTKNPNTYYSNFNATFTEAQSTHRPTWSVAPYHMCLVRIHVYEIIFGKGMMCLS